MYVSTLTNSNETTLFVNNDKYHNGKPKLCGCGKQTNKKKVGPMVCAIPIALMGFVDTLGLLLRSKSKD